MRGPFSPYTLMNCCLVGRPAIAKRRVPSAMRARADLDRAWARLVVFFAFFVFIVCSLHGTREPYAGRERSKHIFCLQIYSCAECCVQDPLLTLTGMKKEDGTRVSANRAALL